MGKCPNCDNKGLFLKTVKCKVCGREGCEKCLRHILSIAGTESTGDGRLQKDWDNWYLCSEDCLVKLASWLGDEMSLDDVDLGQVLNTDIEKFMVRAIQNPRNKEWVGDELRKKIDKMNRKVHDGVLSFWWASARERETDRYDHFEARKANPLYRSLMEDAKRLARNFELGYAKKLEQARRFEEAARIYERFGMYEEAGRIRARGEEIVVRRTDVSVDLNRLLQQVRDGGIVVVYRCSHCGGNLKIGKDTRIESLKVCPYCESRIEAIELADFLRTALS
jgi:DNA-directed RNA polymerase subunit RPC12/RpoP